jgi:L-fuconate dehydratase
VTRITSLRTHDVRARTSRSLAGSDAVHTDPDYSAAYLVLGTDGPHEGHGFTFTIGRGNDLCCAAIEALGRWLVGVELAELTGDMAAFSRRLTNDSQLRWLGPEKGVVHLATAAIVNAVWDLWAKEAGTPVWQLVAGLTPEELVACVDFRHLTDALRPDEAVELVRASQAGRDERLAAARAQGYPAYVTSAGWLGYPEEQVRELCRQHRAEGWTSFKTKVGVDVASDVRRCEVMREELGDGGS